MLKTLSGLFYTVLSSQHHEMIPRCVAVDVVEMLGTAEMDHTVTETPKSHR